MEQNPSVNPKIVPAIGTVLAVIAGIYFLTKEDWLISISILLVALFRIWLLTRKHAYLDNEVFKAMSYGKKNQYLVSLMVRNAIFLSMLIMCIFLYTISLDESLASRLWIVGIAVFSMVIFSIDWKNQSW